MRSVCGRDEPLEPGAGVPGEGGVPAGWRRGQEPLVARRGAAWPASGFGASPLEVDRLHDGRRVAAKRPERGNGGVQRGVAEALGVGDGGASVGKGGGRVKGRLDEGAGGVGERPGDSPGSAKGSPAGEAPYGAGVEAEAERLVPVLLLARRKDEPRTAVAAGLVRVDVKIFRDLATEELPPGVTADRAGGEVGPVVGVVRPGAARTTGGTGAREERYLAEERVAPRLARRTAARDDPARAGFHPSRETERPAP